MNLLGCLGSYVVIAGLDGDTKHFYCEKEELGP